MEKLANYQSEIYFQSFYLKKCLLIINQVLAFLYLNGFGGELKDWIYSLLLDKSNFNYEIFNYNEVYNKLNDHMNYKNDNSDLLWCLAMLKFGKNKIFDKSC